MAAFEAASEVAQGRKRPRGARGGGAERRRRREGARVIRGAVRRRGAGGAYCLDQGRREREHRRLRSLAMRGGGDGRRLVNLRVPGRVPKRWHGRYGKRRGAPVKGRHRSEPATVVARTEGQHLRRARQAAPCGVWRMEDSGRARGHPHRCRRAPVLLLWRAGL